MELLGFLVGATYLPFIISGAFAPRWWAILVGGALLAAERRDSLIRATPAHWWGLAFVVYCAVSVLWAYPAARWDQANALIELAGAAVIFLLATQHGDLSKVWIALGWSLVPNAVVCILQRLGIPLFNPGMMSVTAPGLFLNRDLLDEFAVMVFLGLIWAVRPPKSWRVYNFLLASAAICAILPGGRSGWLALGVCAFAAMYKRAGLSGKAVLDAGAVMLSALFVWQFTVNDYAAVSNREDFIALTLANLKPFGWGYGVYYWLFSWHYVHNEYLQFVFDLGIGAVLIVPAILWAVWWRDDSYEGTTSERMALLALAVTCLAGFPLHAPATVFVGALCLGRLVGARVDLCDSRSVSRSSGLAHIGPGAATFDPRDGRAA